MRLLIVKSADPQETRTPILPTDAGRLAKLGAQVEVEAGIGAAIGIADGEYETAGAKVSADRAGVVVRGRDGPANGRSRRRRYRATCPRVRARQLSGPVQQS